MVDVDDVREAPADEADLRHRQGKGRAQRHHHRRRSPARCRRCCDGDTVGLMRSDTERNPLRIELRLPHRPPHQRRRSGAGAGQRRRRATGAAGRTGTMGNRPRRPDDLPQESAARGLRVRRNRRPSAGRRGGRRAGRPSRPGRLPRDDQRTSATAGWPTPRRGRSTSGRFSPTAAASPGACRRASPSISPAKASGRSRSTCSATWAWPSAPR